MQPTSIHSKKVTFGTLLIALGIIYGDIGTSPLYVLKAIVGDRIIDESLVLGGVSAIIWTLVFQTTIKYVWITLKADNHGEGGIFSLYALVRHYGKYLVIPTILGATALLADGMLTPPISVSSAVEGLHMLMPDIPTVPIVVIILSSIFFFQRFGTQKVGTTFGPIMVIWFAMILVFGVIQIFKYPAILQAANPVYVYEFLVNYPEGFWLLGAVFLATTGAEALYSDLGHCGRDNIRISWAFVKICLLANYFGQAAWIMSQGGDYLNDRLPFFEIMPHWFLLPGILIATMATIIASQAMITGSYTLINEAMSLNFWPRIAVRQPTDLKGQIYIPSINTLLWAGCIFVILYFQNSTRIEGVYGFFITLTMITTTFLLSHYLYYRKKWRMIVVAPLFIFFLSIEASFLVANSAKLTEGWVLLVFAFSAFATMYVWYFARKIHSRFIKLVSLSKFTQQIKDLSEDDQIPKFATHLIYLSKASQLDEIDEKIINSIFAKKPKRADVYWFVHINRTDAPYTLEYEVTELVEDKVIKVNINAGFRVQPRTELYFKKIVQDLVANQELNLHIRPDGSTKYNPEPDFRFVIIEKFLSAENEFAFHDDLLLKAYFLLKPLSQSVEKGFGLDKSDVTAEYVPLIYHPVQKIELLRKSDNSETK